MRQVFRLRIERLSFPILLATLVAGLAGCGEDPARTCEGFFPIEYVAYDSPDTVIANLGDCWERLDLVEYRDSVLYSGVRPSTDGKLYSPFVFYYDPSNDPDLPEFDPFDRDIQRMTRLFSGLPGEGVPGVKSIAISFTAIGDWEPIEGCDECPPAALQREYAVDCRVPFKATIGDTEVSAVLIQERMLMTCLPTVEYGATHWRLWQWRELPNRGVAEATLGWVKSRYPPAPKAH